MDNALGQATWKRGWNAVHDAIPANDILIVSFYEAVILHVQSRNS